jgi:hypothetical protein
VLDVGVLLILNLEVVGWELSDGEVGGADGSLVADDVGSLSDSSGEDVVDVGLISLGHWICEILNIFLKV